ncbi:MAG TPA: ABC transporter permease [Fredinandcohnia sp.]|nr:ABC transporter permease [Fredinandcohnia sp.]
MSAELPLPLPDEAPAFPRRRPLVEGLGPRIGLGIVIVLVLVAIFAPWLSPHDPRAIALESELLGPSGTHPLGTAENGVDVLAHVLYGARISLFVGVFATLIAAVVGTLLGAWAAWVGGVADEILMRVVDVLLAFPGILLAIFITAVLGPSLGNVILALCATSWTGYARLARAQVLSLREREFVLAARALGATDRRILFGHLLPNLLGPVVVQATFGIPGAMLAEASLSFLGLGVPPGTPSWGALVDQGTQYLLVAPHVALFPGLAIAVAVLGFNLLGDGLRDRLDPRASRRRAVRAGS